VSPSLPAANSLINRRFLLQAGGLDLLRLGLLGSGFVGSGLPRQYVSAAHTPAAGFGQAKACIFLFMWGGPSQLDTLDPKPHAPAEVRGEFKTIATRTPGLHLSEHFKGLANLTDRVAIVRSLYHNDPAHLSSAHATLTGHLAPVVRSDRDPPSDRDTPHFGSLIARQRPSGKDAVPPFVTMPWLAHHPAAPGGNAPGQHGGWLGAQYDPLLVQGDPNQADWKAPALELRNGVPVARLLDRRKLLHDLNAARRYQDALQEHLAQGTLAADFTRKQADAFGLLGSAQVREAFNLAAEPEATRDRYGRHIHGQCVLLARRLVERGVSVASVNWHNDGQNFWDTHGANFSRLKNQLIPPADQALSALLEDLDQRGMLEQTIVAWVGEFGRRPQISAGNAGREHWPFCYSGLLAGGGIQGGAVHGRSDAIAAYPVADAVSPHDFTATLLHALGVPHDLALPDRDKRPHRIYAGTPLPLFG